jgi:hypothetical protein
MAKFVHIMVQKSAFISWNLRSESKLWWLICVVVFSPRDPTILTFKFSSLRWAGSRDENTQISGGAGEILFIKLRPATPLINVFLLRAPAVKFLKSCSAVSPGDVFFIKTSPPPARDLSGFAPRHRHFNFLIFDFSLGGVDGRNMNGTNQPP